MKWSLAFVFASLFLSCGCRLYDVPTTGPSKDAVFAAAEAVLAQHYPIAMSVRKSDMIIARTELSLDAAYKSCRQITVHVTQNYTGAWEPTVRIVKHVELSDPPLQIDPQSPDPAGAYVVAKNEWKPLQYMSLEEVALQREIQKRIKG